MRRHWRLPSRLYVVFFFSRTVVLAFALGRRREVPFVASVLLAATAERF